MLLIRKKLLSILHCINHNSVVQFFFLSNFGLYKGQLHKPNAEDSGSWDEK